MTAKKPHPQKSFPATVTFRPDQEPAVRALQAQRKLSTVCQKAVDLDTELEEATAAPPLDMYCLTCKQSFGMCGAHKHIHDMPKPPRG